MLNKACRIICSLAVGSEFCQFGKMSTVERFQHCYKSYNFPSRLREEEEARLQMEEARRLAEEMKRQQYELEMRLRFNRSLQLESTGLSQTQDITRAFVFSYFELLQWLGLDVPDFETWKKMQSY